MHYKIKKGLDIALEGATLDRTLSCPSSDNYCICPTDFRWLTPRLLVQEGDSVNIGTPLFADKHDERIVIVSPVQGTVREIVRGEKRALQAIIIGRKDSTSAKLDVNIPENLDGESIRTILLQYGLWPCLRQRPFTTIAKPDDHPKSIFVSCFDSAPLAPNYNILMKGREEKFQKGLDILRLLADNVPIHLCMRQGTDNTMFENCSNVEFHYFEGPHPAGNVGTQIHHVDPIAKGDVVWFISPQDVAMIGNLFLNHTLSFERMAAITGPCAKSTGYLTYIYGTNVSDFLKENQSTENVRTISGNVLTGQVLDVEKIASIRFYDHQITLLEEGGKREFIGWSLPGFKKWSYSHTFLSWLTPKHAYKHNTTLHGGRRTFMMTDVYDKIFPFDIIPLSLLKACYTLDIEQMEALGIYEVDDEDFALCEVVCPSKMECQQIVRDALFKLKKENE